MRCPVRDPKESRCNVQFAFHGGEANTRAGRRPAEGETRAVRGCPAPLEVCDPEPEGEEKNEKEKNERAPMVFNR